MAANFGDTINVNALLSSSSVDTSEQEDSRPFAMVSIKVQILQELRLEIELRQKQCWK